LRKKRYTKAEAEVVAAKALRDLIEAGEVEVFGPGRGRYTKYRLTAKGRAIADANELLDAVCAEARRRRQRN
jgi:hypothetical protein